MLQLPVYLDNNATTACDPLVLEAMMPYFTRHFGNAASRSHIYGWQAAEAVDLAREQVAALVGAEPKEIVFTSGATEADNLAIKGVYEAYASRGNHIITVATEHKAVLDTCRHLEKLGADISYLPVDREGNISVEQLESLIKPSTILIAIMFANNETGGIHPVRQIGAIARKNRIPFFCDASQAIGRIPVNVIDEGIDLLAFSAHKLYGPKGVGALYVRRKDPRIVVRAQMDGGGHERGMRSGTLNVPSIVGFGKACSLAAAYMQRDASRLGILRDRLENSLTALEEVYVNGNRASRLPNTCNLSFKYIESEALMMGFGKDLAVSSGSACTSASPEPSYVLKALGLDDEMAHGSIRFALGRFTTAEEIDYAIERVSQTVREIRKTSRRWQLFKERTSTGH